MKGSILVCGPTPEGTYYIRVDGSPVFRDMGAADMVRYLRAATARYGAVVSYSQGDGKTLHDGIPLALAEAMKKTDADLA